MASTMLEALNLAGLVDPDKKKEAQKRETRQERIVKKRLARLSAARGFDRHGIRVLEPEE